MKKEYVVPATDIIEIKTEAIIANSMGEGEDDTSIGIGEGDADNNQEVLSNKHRLLPNIWDCGW